MRKILPVVITAGAAAVSMVAGALVTPAAGAAMGPDYVGDPVLVRPNDPGDKAFGNAVDVDGDTMVVGAVCDETAGGNCDGSAYIFERSGDEWVQQVKIVPRNITPFAEYGKAVAVSGDTVVVGSGFDNGGQNVGAVYVYVRTDLGWRKQAMLRHKDPKGRDDFGASVALEGDTLVVGARRDDFGGLEDAGTATVFVRSAGTWTRQAMLRAADPGAGDHYGESVALQGDTAMVGAPAQDSPKTGAVYVLNRTGATWAQTETLSVPAGEGGVALGTAVAIDGDTAVAGSDSGRTSDAHVFVRSGSTWSRQARLTAVGGGSSSFGETIDIDGDTVVVGDSWWSGDKLSAGAAYVFTRVAGTWDAGVRVVNPVRNDYDHFAASVALDAGSLYIGAYVEPEAAVFVYDEL